MHFLAFSEMKPLAMICLSCNQRLCLKRFVNGWPRLLLNRRQLPGDEVPMRGRHFDRWPMPLEPVSSLKRSIVECQARSLWPYHQMSTMPSRCVTMYIHTYVHYMTVLTFNTYKSMIVINSFSKFENIVKKI